MGNSASSNKAEIQNYVTEAINMEYQKRDASHKEIPDDSFDPRNLDYKQAFRIRYTTKKNIIEMMTTILCVADAKLDGISLRAGNCIFDRWDFILTFIMQYKLLFGQILSFKRKQGLYKFQQIVLDLFVLLVKEFPEEFPAVDPDQWLDVKNQVKKGRKIYCSFLKNTKDTALRDSYNEFISLYRGPKISPFYMVSPYYLVIE